MLWPLGLRDLGLAAQPIGQPHATETQPALTGDGQPDVRRATDSE